MFLPLTLINWLLFVIISSSLELSLNLIYSLSALLLILCRNIFANAGKFAIEQNKTKKFSRNPQMPLKSEWCQVLKWLHETVKTYAELHSILICKNRFPFEFFFFLKNLDFHPNSIGYLSIPISVTKKVCIFFLSNPFLHTAWTLLIHFLAISKLSH